MTWKMAQLFKYQIDDKMKVIIINECERCFSWETIIEIDEQGKNQCVRDAVEEGEFNET